MIQGWQDYQKQAAAFFRSLGLDAKTDVRLHGVRTCHDVDVVVRLNHVGFEVVWLVECKQWQTRVSKIHVMALREIVSDIGADRGVLLCEAGFQSGAIEAANLTNVRLTTLEDLKETASADILAMRLRELFDRTDSCKRQYWDIPKEVRIRRGLRPDFEGDFSSSGARIVEFAEEALAKAFRGSYPFDCDSVGALMICRGPRTFTSLTEVLKTLEPLISDLERRLGNAAQ